MSDAAAEPATDDDVEATLGAQPDDDAEAHVVGAWERMDAPAFLRAVGQGLVPRAPHADHVGLRIADASPGHVELEWLPRAHICNRAGIVHGGYLAIVLDDAAGLAAASLGQRFIPMLTMDLRIEYVRPALPDVPYRAIGTTVHAGKTRVIADGRIEDADGRLLARASGTFTPNRAFTPERMAE